MMEEERNDTNGYEQDEEGRLGGYAVAYEDLSGVPFPGDIRSASASAVWAGAVSGAAMALFMMILYGVLGLGFWLPLKLVAVPLVGPAAVLGGAQTVFTGFVLHELVSILVAIVFAVTLVSLLGRVGPGAGAISGILFALMVWVVAQYVVLPVTYPLVASGMAPMIFGLAHAAYGIVLGLLPTCYRVSHEEYKTAMLAQ